MIVLELCERCRRVAFRAFCNVAPMRLQTSRLLFNRSIKQDSRIIWLDMANSDGSVSVSHNTRAILKNFRPLVIPSRGLPGLQHFPCPAGQNFGPSLVGRSSYLLPCRKQGCRPDRLNKVNAKDHQLFTDSTETLTSLPDKSRT